MQNENNTEKQVSMELNRLRDKIVELEQSNLQFKKNEKILKESIGRYKDLEHIINHTPAIVFLWKAADGWPVEFVSDNISNFGYTPEDFYSGRVPYADIIHPHDLDRVAQEVDSYSQKVGHESFKQEYRIIAKDGQIKWTDDRTWIRRNEEGEITHYQGIVLDITDRKMIEKALKESENKYRTIFEHTGTATAIIGEDTTLLLVNEEFEKISGYKNEELAHKKSWTEFVVKEDLGKMIEYHQNRRINQDIAPEHYEFRFLDRDKNLRYVLATVVLFPESKKSLASLIDITGRKKTEKKVQKALEEKDLLLKEIYHRVKNNLMVISSLLNIQSKYIKDKESFDIFVESQTRAKSMALIHEKLYRSSDLKRINFGEYIRNLSTDLFHTYVSDTSNIDLNLKVQNLMLDINTIVPLGLILNELVSNALKHAFPDGRKGEILIDFHQENDNYLLLVKDNGIGFPDNIDYKNTQSLGLQLVNSLSDQIDAKIELNKSEGTCFMVKFKEMEL